MPTTDANVSLREDFINLVYENEREIFTSFQLSYPSQLTPYMILFQNINYDDICTYGAQPNETLPLACKEIS
jgi:hypothetical protein